MSVSFFKLNRMNRTCVFLTGGVLRHVSKARLQNREKRLLASSCPSFRPHGRTRLLLHEFSWNFISIFRQSVEKIQVWYLTRITGTIHEDLCTFFIISRPVLLRMRNVSDKSCRETQNTHFMFSNIPFMRQCGKMWYSQRGYRGQYTLHMRFACWITKTADTEY